MKKNPIAFALAVYLLSSTFLLAMNKCQEEEEPALPASYVTVLPDEDQQTIRKEFGKHFRILRTDHFDVISDESLRFHRVLAGYTEIFYRQVRARFFKRKFKRIRVFCVRDTAAWNKLIKNKEHPELEDSYGAYMPSDKTVYFRRKLANGHGISAFSVFRRVMSALVANEFKKSQPPWFAEGLSALFESTSVIKDEFHLGNPNVYRAFWLKSDFENDRVPKISDLLTMPEKQFYKDGYRNVTAARSLLIYLSGLGEKNLKKLISSMRSRPDKPIRAFLRAAKLKKIEDAEEAWRKSIRDVSLAGYYVRAAMRDPANALEILEEGAKKYPRYGVVQLHLAIALQNAGDDEGAIAHAQAALKDKRLPQPDLAHIVMASSYGNVYRRSAIQSYRKAIALQPWLFEVDAGAYGNLANLLIKMDEKKQAIEVKMHLRRLQEEDQIAP